MPPHKSILKKTPRDKTETLPFKRFKTALATYTDVKNLYDDIEAKINKTDVLSVVSDVTHKIKIAEVKSERLLSVQKEHPPILNCTCLLKMFEENHQKLQEVCAFFDTAKTQLEDYSEKLHKDLRPSWNCSESIREMQEDMSDIVTMAHKIWQSDIALRDLNKKLQIDGNLISNN